MRRLAAMLALALLLAACARESPTETPTPPTPTATATATVAPSATATATLEPTPTATPESAPTGTATLAPTPTSAPTAADVSAYDRVLQSVVELRGLDAAEGTTPQFLTREELTASLIEDLDEDMDDLLNAQALYRLLGLIPPDADLRQLLLDLYGEQVAGFYDTETEELYLIAESEGRALSATEELTLAHEFTHALQQQVFDIHSMRESVEDNADEAAALLALIEGDASILQSQYMLERFTQERLMQALAEGASVDSSALDSTPYVLQQSLLFPYVHGANFVIGLAASLGIDFLDPQAPSAWGIVDDAYDDPPASTEQILHPQKYVERESPVPVDLPDAAAALGMGWESVDSDVMGEFFLRTYLETRIGQGTAAAIAQGWGGDRYALLRGPDDQHVLISHSVWDTDAEAEEFYDAMVDTESVAASRFLGLNGDGVLWIISPSQEVTDSLRSLWPEFWPDSG